MLVLTHPHSVFKHKHKLVYNQSPVSNRHCLFLLNLHQSEVYHFLHSIIRREWTLWFSVLSDFSIQIFYEVCGVDYFPDFQWKLEENSQVISVILPWKDGIRVLPFPFLFQIIQFYGSSLLVGRVIDVLHIGCKLFLVLVNDIFAGVPESDVRHIFVWKTEEIRHVWCR